MRIYRGALIICLFAFTVFAIGTFIPNSRSVHTWKSSATHVTQLHVKLEAVRLHIPPILDVPIDHNPVPIPTPAPPVVAVVRTSAPTPVIAPVTSGSTSHTSITTPTPDTSALSLWPAATPSWVISTFNCIADVHESGGNPRAANPSSTASGLYQFLDSSWMDYGGGQYASRAMYASVPEQNAVAWHAYQVSGFQPWDGDQSCWT